MKSNRRRHANVVPVATLGTWVLLAAFLCCAGLYYVYCKNQLHTRGALIKNLERELAELQNQNEVVRSRIAVLSSPNALRKRREGDKTFLAGYAEITQDRLVMLSDKVAHGSELRAVSNERP